MKLSSVSTPVSFLITTVCTVNEDGSRCPCTSDTRSRMNLRCLCIPFADRKLTDILIENRCEIDTS